MERLQKVIAQAGVTSRRKAESLILEGKVKVNGKVVTELGTKVTSKDDEDDWLCQDQYWESMLTYEYYNGKKTMDIFTIAGTVVDKNRTKHTVSLLTPTGIATVKFNKGAFNHYNKQISSFNKQLNKSVVVDTSWFERGSLVMVKGYRQDDRFMARNYSGHTVSRIVGTRDKDLLWLQTDRHGSNN